MKTGPTYRQPVQVLFHQNAGFTRVEYLRTGSSIEIPTAIIPADLRGLGSQFLLVFSSLHPEPSDTHETHREALAENTTIERMA